MYREILGPLSALPFIFLLYVIMIYIIMVCMCVRVCVCVLRNTVDGKREKGINTQSYYEISGQIRLYCFYSEPQKKHMKRRDMLQSSVVCIHLTMIVITIIRRIEMYGLMRVF